MKRYITINTLSGSEFYDYSLDCKTFGPSQADKSHFVPVTDLSQIVGNMTDSDRMAYDFPDGKDTGASVPLSRRRGEDIAVLITEGRKLKKEVDSELSDAIEAEKNRQVVDNLLKSSVSSSDSSNSSKE